MNLDLGDDYFELDPDEARQRLQRASRPGDDVATGVTVRQAAIMANLIEAHAQGHDLTEALDDIHWFLVGAWMRAAVPDAGISGRPGLSADDAWALVERWPTPPSGPPRGSRDGDE